MKVLFVGDTHAGLRCASLIPELAHRYECGRIIQLGDFAYTREPRVDFLTRLSDKLASHNLELHWLDGNHDDHEILKTEYRRNGFGWTAPHIWHIPRAHRWNWGGVSFLGLGGAYSIDKDYRKPGRSWWPEEMITDAQVEHCGTDPVDVLVCHDSPLEDPFKHIPAEQQLRVNLKHDAQSRLNRARLRRVVDATKPKLVVHGHLHFSYEDKIVHDDGSETRVIGLANDGLPGWAWVGPEVPRNA